SFFVLTKTLTHGRTRTAPLCAPSPCDTSVFVWEAWRHAGALIGRPCCHGNRHSGTHTHTHTISMEQLPILGALQEPVPIIGLLVTFPVSCLMCRCFSVSFCS
uniref:Uncharacterized protein n=1 Tax=Nothobranchius furzeri TaxID=105023 RepID=A0A8C6KB44_NOTFU